MFIQHFQLVKEYLWIVVAKIIVDSTVKNQPYQGLENPQIGMVSADSSMEPTRVQFLNSTWGFTVHLTSAALTMTATKPSNNFLEKSSCPKVLYFTFSKKCRYNQEIRADQEISFGITHHVSWLLTPWLCEFSFNKKQVWANTLWAGKIKINWGLVFASLTTYISKPHFLSRILRPSKIP